MATKKNVAEEVKAVVEEVKATKVNIDEFAETIVKAFAEAQYDEIRTVIHFYMPESKRNYFGMYPSTKGVRISLSADAAAMLAEDERFTVTINGKEANIRCSHENAITVAEMCLTAKKSVPKKEKKAPEKKETKVTQKKEKAPKKKVEKKAE